MPARMIYVAESAVLVGDVSLGDGSSVWHGAVVRGDLDAVVVGENTNLQDNAVVHVDKGSPTRIGRRVTVGHGAVVHGCTVGDDCLVGMNATVGSGVTVGEGSVVAAGAVLPEGAEYPPGSVLMGVPAKRVRETDDGHRLRIDLSWQVYHELARKSLPSLPSRVGDPSRRVSLELTERFGQSR